MSKEEIIDEIRVENKLLHRIFKVQLITEDGKKLIKIPNGFQVSGSEMTEFLKKMTEKGWIN